MYEYGKLVCIEISLMKVIAWNESQILMHIYWWPSTFSFDWIKFSWQTILDVEKKHDEKHGIKSLSGSSETDKI